MPLGSTTLGSVRSDVLRRLNDTDHNIWSVAEIDRYILEAYKLAAHEVRIFWDWSYLENLPRGFSYNYPWEKTYHLITSAHGFDYGRGNFTHDFEREPLRTFNNLEDEDQIDGPANHTSPFERDELTVKYLAAVQDLPSDTIDIDRATWDKAAIDALVPRDLEMSDTRYEITEGDVFGFIWRKDGLYSFRKVRVPAAVATTYDINTSWGVLRSPSDLSGASLSGSQQLYQHFTLNHTWEHDHTGAIGVDVGRATFTYSWESGLLSPEAGPADHTGGSWESQYGAVLFTLYFGVLRRTATQHAFGYTPWGLARRPYDDGNNVRVERWREGRAVSLSSDIFELPDRYTVALRDYAMFRCLSRKGEGQDVRLSGVYQAKWNRAVFRLNRRVRSHRDARVGRLGGEPVRVGPPPRPKLPWQYGQRLR